MDFFIKNIKTKVNTAIDNIINSPSMIRKNLVVVSPTEISPTESDPGSSHIPIPCAVNSGYKTDSSGSSMPGVLSSVTATTISPNSSHKRSGDMSFDETTRSTPDENPTESDETEEKENSESDTSLLDTSLNSTFHRFYHPGYRGNKNISRLVFEDKGPKLLRQVSDPCSNYQSILAGSSYNRKDKVGEVKTQPFPGSPTRLQQEYNDDDETEKPEPYYYPSPRRDSLFDTIQLKSSMNHHLKYGDVKERVSLAKTLTTRRSDVDTKDLRQSSVCESSTNTIILRKQVTIGEMTTSGHDAMATRHEGSVKVAVEKEEEEVDKLGDIGIALIDEDGRHNSLEIDITDIEAVEEESDLKNARRQSISDRLNKRRNSDIMAEIIRLSAENRRKEFKGLLNDYTKIVRSIDNDHSPRNPLKRDLFTLDSVDASSEDSEVHQKYGLVGKETTDPSNHSNNHHIYHGNRCYRQQFNLASRKPQNAKMSQHGTCVNKTNSNSEDSNNDKGSSNASTSNSKEEDEEEEEGDDEEGGEKRRAVTGKCRGFVSNSALPD